MPQWLQSIMSFLGNNSGLLIPVAVGVMVGLGRLANAINQKKAERAAKLVAAKQRDEMMRTGRAADPNARATTEPKLTPAQARAAELKRLQQERAAKLRELQQKRLAELRARRAAQQGGGQPASQPSAKPTPQPAARRTAQPQPQSQAQPAARQPARPTARPVSSQSPKQASQRIQAKTASPRPQRQNPQQQTSKPTAKTEAPSRRAKKQAESRPARPARTAPIIGEAAPTATKPHHVGGHSSLFSSREDLRRAIVAREVLGPPVALRQVEPGSL